MTPGGNDAVARLARRLTEKLQGLRRRGSMNYSVNFTELAALLGVVESLAPEFEDAFREDNVATLQPRGGQRVEGAVAIRALRAALEHEPEAWFLRLMLGYYLVLERGDEQAAAAELLQAAAHPEVPFYVRSLARRLQPNGAGEEQGPGGEPRLFRLMSQAQSRVDAFRAREGRAPSSVEEALSDEMGQAVLTQLEVDLVLDAVGQVVTRESQIRDGLARDRMERFERVRPYRLPEY